MASIETTFAPSLRLAAASVPVGLLAEAPASLLAKAPASLLAKATVQTAATAARKRAANRNDIAAGPAGRRRKLNGREARASGRTRDRAAFGRRAAAPARKSLVNRATAWPEPPRVRRPLATARTGTFGKLGLANMTHELRTPLNAIIGFSEAVLSENHGPLGDPRYRGYVDDILTSGQHLLGIVEDMLDLSKFESGQHKLREEEVHLVYTIEAAIRTMAAQAGEAGVIMDMRVPGDLPTVWADERALKQILLNLMANAIRFSPAGGRVTVSAQLDGGGSVCLAVTDEGPGMSGDEIARCLQPFGQTGTVAADGSGYTGTGLGLPIVRTLAEAHGGGLRVDSTPGDGTTMTVRLPGRRTVHQTAHRQIRATVETAANDNRTARTAASTAGNRRAA